MLRIVRDVLIPALPALTLADVLVRAGLPLTLIGDCRAATAAGGRAHRFAESYTSRVGRCGVLAHLSPRGRFRRFCGMRWRHRSRLPRPSMRRTAWARAGNDTHCRN